jgi:hypothetical protein
MLHKTASGWVLAERFERLRRVEGFGVPSASSGEALRVRSDDSHNRQAVGMTAMFPEGVDVLWMWDVIDLGYE